MGEGSSNLPISTLNSEESYAEYSVKAHKFLKQHFAEEIDAMNIEVCVDHLVSGLLSNPYEGYTHSHDIKALEDLRRKLFSFADLGLSWFADETLYQIIAKYDRNGDEKRSIYKALEGLKSSHELIAPAIAELIDVIKTDTDNTRGHAQRNHLAINAISVCHNFWNIFKDKPAPEKGINPASPFGKFTHDYFELMGIEEASVISSFNAWRKKNDRLKVNS